MGLEPYGTAIFNAIERGDAARLSRLLETARQIHQAQGGDLSKAIRSGEAALKKLKAKK